MEEADPSGRCAAVMGLLSVLAETGVSRRLLHAAAGEGEAADMDAAAGRLADASLVGFSRDDAVTAHRLVMRVARERMAADGRLPSVAAEALHVLLQLAVSITEAYQDPAGVRELAAQVSALTGHLKGHLDVIGVDVSEDLLQLRLWSVFLLNNLGDSTGQVILAAEPLVADFEQMLGADDPDTLSSRNSLALAYSEAGRTAEAITLYERTLTDRLRVLGSDDPDTLTSRNNLAAAYNAAGRTAEAISLLERNLADSERVLGGDHPSTLTYRINLANAYSAAGLAVDAISLLGGTLTDLERVLGTNHPNTMACRCSLASAYGAAGLAAGAIPLYKQALTDCERVLGSEHPSTLLARGNLAYAHEAAGRTAEAIPLLERNLADSERALGADHPITEAARDGLASALRPTRSKRRDKRKPNT
jgi:tetratricopeptide (TPR) repeat protein